MIKQESYTCPWCGMTSYHPEDVRHEYCGNCHKTREELMVQDAAPIVKKLKERTRDHPWAPTVIASREHFHMLPNGLGICFTQDILEGGRYWHLSISRIPRGPTAQEVEFWRRAFFDQEPIVERPGRLKDDWLKHFYWRVECG